jgi:hypothetical protein
MTMAAANPFSQPLLSRDLFVQMSRLVLHAVHRATICAPSRQPHEIDARRLTPPDAAAFQGQTFAAVVMAVAMDPRAPKDVELFVPAFREAAEAALARSHASWLASGAPDDDLFSPDEEAERLAALIPELLLEDA